MDTKTGEIFLTKEILNEWLGKNPEASKNIVQLPADIAQILVNMSRKQRREYYRQHKKEFEGLSWAEVTDAMSARG